MLWWYVLDLPEANTRWFSRRRPAAPKTNSASNKFSLLADTKLKLVNVQLKQIEEEGAVKLDQLKLEGVLRLEQLKMEGAVKLKTLLLEQELAEFNLEKAKNII